MSMKQLFTSATCVGLLLAATVTAASAANLVLNPRFETGDLTSWQSFGTNPPIATITVQTPDNGPSAPGIYNAFLNNQQQANAVVLKQSSGPATAGPGTVYYYFDLKTDRIENGGVVFVHLFAERAGGGVLPGGDVLLGPFWPNGWTAYSGLFVAPANTDFVTIQFEAVTGAVQGSIVQLHVDNVCLTQDQGPTPAQPTSWGRMKALYR